MGKTKAFTKKHLRKYRARVAAERKLDETTVDFRESKKQARESAEIEKMMGGVNGA